jgi:hypothetical protein
MNIRQQIVDALETRMAAIGGIKKVAVWKVTDFAPAEHPVILIKDTVDSMPSDGVGKGKIDHELTIELTALFFGSTASSQAREVIASILAAIGTDSTFSGLAYDCVINSAELDIDETGKLISAAVIDMTVFYRSDLWTI